MDATKVVAPNVTVLEDNHSNSSSKGVDPKGPPEVRIRRDGTVHLEEPEAPKGLFERLKHLAGGWFFEYCSVFISAVALVGLSVLLWHFNEKPEPAWTFGPVNSVTGVANHITLNSVISLFTSTASAAIAFPLSKALGQLTWVWFKKSKRQLADVTAFDAACKQSPIGSLKLIYMLKGRHFAVIGAVVVICLHLYHFFTQQLIQTKQWYWPDFPDTLTPPQPTFAQAQPVVDQFYNGTLTAIPQFLEVARIANASNYTTSDLGQAPYYNVDTQLKGNLWAALYGSDTNADWAIPSYYCATGNCSFVEYASIGVCSRCASLNSQIIKSCTAEPARDLSNTTAGCDILLPNGFALGGPERRRDTLMAMGTSYKPLIYSNYTNPLVVVQSIIANDTLFVNSSSSLSATECVLFPCVISYSNASSYSDPNTYKMGYNSISFSEYAEAIYDSYEFNKSAAPWDGPTFNIPANSRFPRPTTYKMDQRAFTGLSTYLTALFNGYAISSSATPSNNTVSFAGANISQTVPASSADAMQAIFQPIGYCPDIFGTPLSDWAACSLSSMAIGITNVMRGSAPGNFDFSTPQATGQTFYPKPTIVVAWLWLLPVGGLWLLSVILLIGTVIKTSRAGVKNLGLNPLALIFLGVEQDDDEEGGRAGPVPNEWWSEDEVKKRAEKMRVQLDMRGRRASLVKGPLASVKE